MPSDSEQMQQWNAQYRSQYADFRKQLQFNMVLLLLCGLMKFNGYPSEVLDTLCDKAKTSNFSPRVVCRNIDIFTLYWLFEAQDNDVTAKLLGSTCIQHDRYYWTMTPLECFVLGYCVSHSNCTWKICLRHCDIGDEGMEMFSMRCSGGGNPLHRRDLYNRVYAMQRCHI